MTPRWYAAAGPAYLAALLALDTQVGLAAQLALGVLTWLVLLAALAPLAPVARAQALAVVVFATVGEVTGSLVWGVYTYRLHNLPLFVPPGHGLIYLGGISLSEAGLVRSRPRVFLWAVTACAVLWALAGLTVLPRLDVAGALGVATFLFFLWRGRAPAVYGGVFVVVAFLELWGTAIGLWQWHAITPGLGLPMGNPPSGAMSGYVLFDVVAIAVTARFAAPVAPATAGGRGGIGRRRPSGRLRRRAWERGRVGREGCGPLPGQPSTYAH